MAGPLPDPNRRRRNAPTIPQTLLPARGRIGRLPKMPEWVTLGVAGQAFWRWAWRTPQATAWTDGMEAIVARRAQIEDALAGRERGDPMSALLQRALDMDRQLGLTPKAMAELRWSIAPDEVDERRSHPSTAHRLKAVDSGAVAHSN